MTPNAAKLQRICQNNDMPVLFISDPANGDRFEFGTLEELAEEARAWRKEAMKEKLSGIYVQIFRTSELLNMIDFETYEGNQPIVLL
jgi:hypothetical protein